MESNKVRELVKKIYDALSDKKAYDVKVIDITELTVVADYFVIASASNPLQMAALQDAVDEVMYKNGVTTGKIEGNKNSTWLLMDYQDVIVHLFTEGDRKFYDLERIWQDGVMVDPADL